MKECTAYVHQYAHNAANGMDCLPHTGLDLSVIALAAVGILLLGVGLLRLGWARRGQKRA